MTNVATPVRALAPIPASPDRAAFYRQAATNFPDGMVVTPAVEALLYSVWCQRQAIERKAAELYADVADLAARHLRAMEDVSEAIWQVQADSRTATGLDDDRISDAVLATADCIRFDGPMTLVGCLLWDGDVGVVDEGAYRAHMAQTADAQPAVA